MQKVGFFLLLLGLCWFSGQGAFLYAQEDEAEEIEDSEDDDSSDDGISLETDWDGYMSDLYSRGDQTFTISLGFIFPTLFHDYNPKIIKDHNWFPLGGAGSLAYTRFLNAHYFLGIEVGVNFNRTLGENTVFIIPIGIRTGWQFLLHRFEFPISLAVGIVPQRYLYFSYTGMFIRLGASGFFRFSPEWSFGLNADWNWYPQWPKKEGNPTAKDIYANIIGVTFAARYHF